MRVLIVHAHHEPRSFCSALAKQAEETLGSAGHEVKVSDLYRQGFDPVSDRRNFTAIKNPDYLKQQMEELEATATNGFTPLLEEEIRKLEWCDLLIFSFPLWWFGLPGILKGWVDRAFPMGRIYGQGKLYENGLGKGQRRAMVLMTTGGSLVAYSGYGVHPAIETVLAPIHHGIFWFNGFQPLDPFIVSGPVRLSEDERGERLAQLDARLRGIEAEAPRRLPPLSDFPEFGPDVKKRFMVSITRKQAADEAYRALIPEERQAVAQWKRDGVALAAHFSLPDAELWRGFLVLREGDREAVCARLSTLPLARYLNFEITELMNE